ncbi:DUF58 domain-containing protein [Erythrobacter sp. HL-111]|uniref:DUF58 domain-containing protein n=1 Tax=Erythrobacter sp. HL-111 TaxID=1798193 RepID=UPI0006DA5E5F|nr:DUF58 domain-containing protein [Erythrobacter sp. HL-111]KPP89452.1 MAG: hypothetical protein HLUCCO15_10255 [Erythrobacteraceae bacterium HL-111]SDS49165.1 Uncharacterized conserved protein, DUF58 family, contains vWF domain [Erythrobacter sp. HL-111]
MNRLRALLARLPALPIVPTVRAAWLVAGLAPVALLIASAAPGAWMIAPAAALALVVLVLLDGLAAGPCTRREVTAPADTEVGQPAMIEVHALLRAGAGRPEAALEFDPRLGLAGRAELQLAPGEEPGLFSGALELVPERRGTAPVTRLWLRWTGPLGLGARQVSQRLGSKIRIWPDLSPVRSKELQAFLRDERSGLIARRIRGEGTQFEALSEYEPGMDRRRIDWKASARHNHLYARENEAERNNQIVFAFDCGQAMCEPLDGLPRIDRAVSAALTCAYVALKGGDRTALFGFARRPQLMTPFVHDTRGFTRLQSAAAALDYESVEPNFTLALATLTARLQRRSLIVLFSDFTDPTAAQLMVESLSRLVRKHLVLFVTFADSELEAFIEEEPGDIATLARSVTADTLARQRSLVLQRLRRMGVDVIEAPWKAVGFELIDRYLAIRGSEAIG